MPRTRTITTATDEFRVGTWHGLDGVAFVGIGQRASVPTAEGLRGVLDELRGFGYGHVVTSALRHAEAQVFLDAGFVERERLVVLRRSVHPPPSLPSLPTRRAGRSDRGAVLAVDTTAFEPAWRLDAEGLIEALKATPRSRFRVVDNAASVAGYAVCGRSGRTGYLQRLAVDPLLQGRGYGRALVDDALIWLARRKATSILVNTQTRNERAIGLYRSMGFSPDEPDLVVLERGLR